MRARTGLLEAAGGRFLNAATALLVAAVFVSAAAAAAPASSAGATVLRANAVRVTTPLQLVAPGAEVTVAVLHALPNAQTYPVRIRLRDDAGTLLQEEFSRVAPEQAALVHFGGSTRTSAGFVRIEMIVGPLPGAPIQRSCPLQLTVQPSVGGASGPTIYCGIDPCIDALPGPPPRTRTFPNCASQAVLLPP